MRSAETNPEDPWPDRLIRPVRSPGLRLGLQNLYILPSSFGWLWLAACAVLYGMGISSSSASALLLAYGSLGLFLLAPFLTQFNLQGLELHCADAPPGFAGAPVRYSLVVQSPMACELLRARFKGQSLSWEGRLPAGRSLISIPWLPECRGLQRPGRLRLESRAPLGLFVCWTLWEPETPQLIYPARNSGPTGQVSVGRCHGAGAMTADDRTTGTEDWQDLTPHRPEEGPGRIAWKQLARSGVRLSKQFSDPLQHATVLCPARGLPLEEALEHLCERCCHLEEAGERYGLVIGSTQIESSAGRHHLQRCLEALALAREP